MNHEIVATSRAVLGARARSFHLASRFLPAAARDDAAVLYAVCRLIDDLADDATDDATARVGLAALRAELTGDTTPRPLVATWHDVALRRRVDAAPLLYLLDTAASDVGPVRIADRRSLLRYAYGVAGTVGLLLCDVLGVTDPIARRHAIDLGVAMQLTNICRDVLEDAHHDRVYLPGNQLRMAGQDPDGLPRGEVDRAAVASVVRDVLSTAERYYNSGEAGFCYLPVGCRLAIGVAARVYREIGRTLIRTGADPMNGRTVVSRPRRVAAVAGAACAGYGPHAATTTRDCTRRSPGCPTCLPRRPDARYDRFA